MNEVFFENPILRGKVWLCSPIPLPGSDLLCNWFKWVWRSPADTCAMAHFRLYILSLKTHRFWFYLHRFSDNKKKQGNHFVDLLPNVFCSGHHGKTHGEASGLQFPYQLYKSRCAAVSRFTRKNYMHFSFPVIVGLRQWFDFLVPCKGSEWGGSQENEDQTEWAHKQQNINLALLSHLAYCTGWGGGQLSPRAST